MELSSQCRQAGCGVWAELHHSAILLDNGLLGKGGLMMFPELLLYYTFLVLLKASIQA